MHPTTAMARTHKFKFHRRPQEGDMDRNKAKPRNATQETILLDYVKKHPRLLQNPTWETRNNLESLWEQLTNELNRHGPPRKDIPTWKKVCLTVKNWNHQIIVILAGPERLEEVHLKKGREKRNAQHAIWH